MKKSGPTRQLLKLFLGVALALEALSLPLTCMDDHPPERMLSRSLSLTQPLSQCSEDTPTNSLSFCPGKKWATHALAKGDTEPFESCMPALCSVLGPLLPMELIRLILSCMPPPSNFVMEMIDGLGSSLQEVNLVACRLSPSFAQRKPSSSEPKISPTITVRILDLSHAELAPEALKFFTSRMLLPECINVWNTPGSFPHLAPLLSPHIRYLNCAGVTLDDQAVGTLTTSFQRHRPKLRELYLHDNPYSETALQALLQGLEGMELGALTLNGAILTEKMMKMMGKILRGNLRFLGIIGASQGQLTFLRKELRGTRGSRHTPTTAVRELTGGYTLNEDGLPSYLHLVQHPVKKKLALKKKRKLAEEGEIEDEEAEETPAKKKGKHIHSQANGMTSGGKDKKPPQKPKPKLSLKIKGTEETPQKPKKRKHSENGKEERAAKRGKHSRDKNQERSPSGGSSSSPRK